MCAALREGAVETLIIGDVGHETVLASDDLTTIALNADVLSWGIPGPADIEALTALMAC